MRFLGIDTSNYTTSAALFDDDTGTVTQKKMLLPVKPGEKGLRQSDAVFHHTVQLPQVLTELFSENPGAPDCVGVSIFPRREKGSYMPCFLVGKAAAEAIRVSENKPLRTFSHQEGHIVAALFSAKRLDLLKETFLAFHVSGGTTEALLVKPNDTNLFSVQIVGQSLDLKAGQLIDRTGVMLSLPFPCGKDLEVLSEHSDKTYNVKPTMKGADCCLSGIENQCQAMFQKGESPADIAKFCMCSVLTALSEMVSVLRKEYGDLPVLFSGGVSSNKLLKKELTEKYGAIFAEPAFSADNAAGIAVLTALMQKGSSFYEL